MHVSQIWLYSSSSHFIFIFITTTTTLLFSSTSSSSCDPYQPRELILCNRSDVRLWHFGQSNVALVGRFNSFRRPMWSQISWTLNLFVTSEQTCVTLDRFRMEQRVGNSQTPTMKTSIWSFIRKTDARKYHNIRKITPSFGQPNRHLRHCSVKRLLTYAWCGTSRPLTEVTSSADCYTRQYSPIRQFGRVSLPNRDRNDQHP